MIAAKVVTTKVSFVEYTLGQGARPLTKTLYTPASLGCALVIVLNVALVAAKIVVEFFSH